MADITKVRKPVFKLVDPNNPTTYQLESMPIQEEVTTAPVPEQKFQQLGGMFQEKGPISDKDKTINERIAPIYNLGQDEIEGEESPLIKEVEDSIKDITSRPFEQREAAYSHYAQYLEPMQQELLNRQISLYEKFDETPENKQIIDRLLNAIREQ